MLDNPNLNLEKTFEIIAHGKNIIGIAVLIIVILLLYIYRYQITLFIRHGFSATKKMRSPSGILELMKTNMVELEEKDLNNKVDNLLQKFEKPVLDDEENDLLQSVDNLILSKNIEHIPPIFRSLKTIKNRDEIIYHFINDGGRIHNFKINPINESNISIEPQNNLETNGSGFLKFENNNIGNEVNFNFSYYDDTNKFHEEKYMFSLLKNKISIVEME